MKKLPRSRSGLANRFPLATIAYYGPTNTLATKLVAAMIERSDHADPSAMRTWTTAEGDVRHDPMIAAEVASFVQQHGAKETITSDGIMGCPHQEGIDYPLGRLCPHCPFWNGVDRFTHQPLPLPAFTLAPEEVIAALSSDPVEPPREALESADAHRAVLVEPLLQALESGLADPSGASPEQATFFCYAMYLLASWREPRAYPYVIRWLTLPDEDAFAIAGDIVTEDGARLLAGVCDGNLEPIKALILDRSVNEYSRSTGVSALALLAAWAEVPRESIVTWFLWLAREGLEREPIQVWNNLAADGADIEAVPLFPELRRAYAEGLIDPNFMDPSILDVVEAAPRGSVLEAVQERDPPIDDVVEATAWWADDEYVDDDADEYADDPVVTPEPYRAPPKVGRNEPCPCGSGKKFKKCCGV